MLIKARAYSNKLDMPVIAMDDTLYFDNVPEDIQPGLYVRRVKDKVLTDDEMIKVISKQEVLFSSQFMANNDLNNYSAIFYAKTIKLMCPIVTNDYNDLKTFFKINKYLKSIYYKKYISFNICFTKQFCFSYKFCKCCFKIFHNSPLNPYCLIIPLFKFLNNLR